MTWLYYVLAVGLIIWLALLLLVWKKKTSIVHEDVSLNPKVNLGRAASVHSIQGARSHMEDTYYGDYQKGFFAVYDGHGGARCSSYAAQNLHELIFKHNFTDQPQLALQEGYKDLDHQWLEIANLNGWDDGSTAVSVLIVNQTIYVANVGDSRAVLCSSGRAVDMSNDHKPAREDERARIEKLGGKVIHYGTWRVQGVLAVSRALGDRRLKTYVSAEPEVKFRELQEGDEFLILASDGVWDVLSSQAAVDIVKQAIGDTNNQQSGSNGSTGSTSNGTGGDVKEAARRLTNAAYSYHSMDNITSLVIDLRQFR